VTRLLIGGELVEGAGALLEVEEPARGEVFASVPLPSEEQVDAAIAAAREASGGWASTPAADRAEMLHEVARRIRERTDALAETMTREGGKPRIENADEVGWTAAAFDYYAEMGRNFAGRVIPPVEASQLALVVKEPMGVVACIVPWNYPLLLLAWKLAPALAAGNACVCKPSELTPLATLGLADCFEPLAAEIEVAARGGAWAAYLNSGQVCTSAERFYVEHAVYDDFLGAFVEHARSLRVGDPLADGTDMGPMVSEAQRAKVERQLEGAVGAGAEIVFGGDHAGHDRGWFMAPTVVTGAAAETALLSEETFGPVAPIVPVRSLDEAIELANSTRFGLGANVYTRDLKTIFRCMREIKAGTVWFNDPLTDNDAGPFGGFKQSGLGRELGQEGLEALQETKHVHIESELAPKDWWYPYGG
jgi:acyl-CoA reductase-like NAD-dependent aldehyde dehydrogenase